jgi:hypothetical protein
LPLPKKTACYSIAGVAGKATASKTKQRLGDNLVGVKSALGRHKNPAKNLDFKEEHTFVAYESSHAGLLGSQEVYTQLKKWML